MLLPREQSSWNCAYFLGAVALKALSEFPEGKCDLLDLQKHMSVIAKRKLSATQVIGASAWLYLIDAVSLDENGMIIRCS
jgi:hypothetical protein